MHSQYHTLEVMYTNVREETKATVVSSQWRINKYIHTSGEVREAPVTAKGTGGTLLATQWCMGPQPLFNLMLFRNRKTMFL